MVARGLHGENRIPKRNERISARADARPARWDQRSEAAMYSKAAGALSPDARVEAYPLRS